MRRERIADESGLTLIEMTIAIAVLAVIIVPIISSFLLSLLESTSARERLADNTAAQLISTYVLGDVQSADTVAKGTSGCTTTGTSKLGMTWNDPSPGSTATFAVDYVDVPTTGGQHELHRMFCTSGGAPSDTLLALNLDSSTFEVICSPTADCSGTPKSVTVRVKAESIRRDTKSSYLPFDFTYTATRRTGL